MSKKEKNLFAMESKLEKSIASKMVAANADAVCWQNSTFLQWKKIAKIQQAKLALEIKEQIEAELNTMKTVADSDESEHNG